jgi:hypothetical protein
MQAEYDATTELRDKLASIRLPLEPAASAALQRTVWDYVDTAKANSWPPERVLAALKRAASDSEIFASSHPTLTPPRAMKAQDHLLADIIRWCIDRYYTGS